MQFIIFGLSYPIIWCFSILPMRLLYIISDFLYLIVYFIFGYRKAIVLENLKIVFPNKSEKQRKTIAKQFYRHFTDNFVETIKAISIGEKEILKRYQYQNPALVKELLAKGKSIAFVSAHQANWEWSVNAPLVLNANVKGAYTTIGNRYFDKIVKASRERFGFKCYPSSKTVKAIFNDFKNKTQSIYLLISDQSPQLKYTQYWTSFFGVKVPFHIGAENLAKKFDLAVVFCATKKIRRGYYNTEFELITPSPKTHKNFEITEHYISLTEQLIKTQPECYLWSHKRFKHKDKFDEWLVKHGKKNTVVSKI